MQDLKQNDISKAKLCELAELRLSEAGALLEAGHYSGAYYLGGYAVECGIKAIIATSFQSNAIPDRKRLDGVFVHNPAKLLNVAGLEVQLQNATSRSPEFQKNWILVKDWSERSRYEIWDEGQARDLYSALNGPNGVMPWLKTFW